MKTRYTVILAYPDQGTYEPVEAYMAHTLAASPDDAVEHARKQCIKKNQVRQMGRPAGL